jgi:methionine--tRNA ligase beta chain
LVKCDKCGWVPLPESELPLLLPQVDSYELTDDGESPLSKMTDWVNTTCPCCGGPAKRETDTMPQWAGSSWYFLRYMDPHNDKELVSKEAEEYWGPVDWYNGGMEHTTLHLLYSRFWHKFLYDIGVVHTKEPYAKRTSHGMILGRNPHYIGNVETEEEKQALLAKYGSQATRPSVKMSKSLGNVVDPFVLGERYGADAIRYHIMREMALGADSSFSNEIMINRINSDLANGFGNLVSRTVAMADKYFGGTLPAERESAPLDEEFISVITGLRAEVDKYIDETKIKQALEAIFEGVSRANKYIDETEPWKLGKDDSQSARLAAVLYNLLEAIRVISTLLSPFMPQTMPKVWEQAGVPEGMATYENAGKFGVLPADVTVKKGEILFPRIDVEKEIEELNAIIRKNMDEAQAKLSEAEAPKEEIVLAPEITIDDFAKIEIRVAKVVSAERVKKSDKLLCLQLDDGMGGRQVVSGIAQYYAPEELVGKKLQLIANLKPVKLRGVDSFGMICAADTPDGIKVVFVDDSIPVGSKIR